MRNLIVIFSLVILSSSSFAQSATDKLILALVDKKLPVVLYEHQDQPWELGVYSLTMNKKGVTEFRSDDRKLRLTIPLEVVLNGKIKKNIFGAKITIGCNSIINTNGKLEIEPIITIPNSKAEVNIIIPVPESYLDCDGFKIPIKPLLDQLVSENKSKWESDLEADIYDIFQKLGI